MVGGANRVLAAVAPLESRHRPAGDPLQGGQVPLDRWPRPPARSSTALAGSASPTTSSGRAGRCWDRSASCRAVVYDQGAAAEPAHGPQPGPCSSLTDVAGADVDRRYLLAIANTAEMRGQRRHGRRPTACSRSSEGRFDLANFGPTDELFLRDVPDPSLVPIEDDEADRRPASTPPALSGTPTWCLDFSIVGPRLAIWKSTSRRPGSSVDGVIRVDVA